MKGDFVYEEMDKLGADGVDFVPLLLDGKSPFQKIYCSFTKAQWEHERSIPKTNRRYWKQSNNGSKQYIK